MYTFLSIPIILFSVVLHEASHGYMAYWLGDDTAKNAGRLTLNPIPHIDIFGTIILPGILLLMGLPVFGWAKPVPFNPANLRNPRRDSMWIAMAGPGSNLLLIMTCILLAKLLGNNLIYVAIMKSQGLNIGIIPSVLFAGYMINLVLMTFNLIPLPPLDGSKILMGLLPVDLAYNFSRIERFAPFLLIALLWFGSGFLNMLFNLVNRIFLRIFF
ncbi:MAG: site-2 protease family protein [Candidatus Coatesbacteria bacterium]|nr:site-2 protease family protein [Candidatus Coatesbacteria bacterium]